MKKILFIISLILLTNHLPAQSLYDLYEDYLPVTNDESFTEVSINKQLYADASLDPGLIYFRLTFYKNLKEKKDVLPASNGLNYIRELTLKKYIERNKWIESQINILKNNYKDEGYYSIGYENLKNRIVTVKDILTSSGIPKDYDKNLDYFYQYIYFTQESGLQYDSSADYFTLCKFEREKIAGSIKQDWDDFRNSSYVNNEELVNKILDYWYIINEFKDIYPDVPTLLAMNPNLRNLPPREKTFSIQIGFFSYLNPKENNLSLKDYSAQFKELGINKSFDVAKVKHLYDLYLSVGKKIYLNESHSAFSYINTAFSFNYIIQDYELSALLQKGNFLLYYFVSEQGMNIPHVFEFFENNFKLGFSCRLSLNLATPVYYLGESTVIEAGVEGGMEFTGSKYSFKFNHVNGYINQLGAYSVTKSINASADESVITNSYFITPTIAIKMNVSKSLEAVLYANIYGVGLKTGIVF